MPLPPAVPPVAARRPDGEPAPAPPGRVGTPGAPAFRPEIQGLRAVAVLLVAAYHVWLGRVSGGVDVFLMLTGFLITGSLLRRVERHGRLGVAAFAARLARRLLPAAALVLLAVLAGTWLVLPRTRWRDTLGEVVASALYYENWRLAASAVDYLARGEAVSPVQHYWSLAMQGQFYVVWPVVIALAAALAALLRRGLRQVFGCMVAAVFVLSLAYSVLRTASDQAWAYFDTAARMWEFALGAGLFLVLPALRPPAWVRVLLGWLGLAALVSCGVLLQVSTVFPGYAALWPTGAAALIIVAGVSHRRAGADRLLTWRPVHYLGDISYPLYLWHWPLLIGYLAVTGSPAPGLAGGCAVLAVSLLLAAGTQWLVDGGLWRVLGRAGRGAPGAGRSLRVGLACMLPVVMVAAGWAAVLERRARIQSAYVADPANYPGARALSGGFAGVRRLPVYPDPVDATDDLPVTYGEQGCNQNIRSSQVRVCVYGSQRAARTIALVGDSHAAHWFPALQVVAEANGWRLLNMTKGACALTVGPHYYIDRPYPACDAWLRGVREELRRHRPDLVVTMATTVTRHGEYVRPGAVEHWRLLQSMGIAVLAIRDTPRLPFRAPECVAARGRDACVHPRYGSLARRSPIEGISGPPANVTFADLTDTLCDAYRCPVVIGNVLVYWDSSHFTATYARTLAPAVREQVRRATGW